MDMRKNYKLASKAKIVLHLFQQNFTPLTQPIRQDEIEITLGPDLSTCIVPSKFLIRKSFKSFSPVRYRDPLRPTSNKEIHMPSFSQIRTQTH
jgi:hypothetical protein